MSNTFDLNTSDNGQPLNMYEADIEKAKASANGRRTVDINPDALARLNKFRGKIPQRVIVSNIVNDYLDKLEFNKKYFGDHLSIVPADSDSMIIVADEHRGREGKDKNCMITIEQYRLYCTTHKSNKCEHIDFALATPYVAKLGKHIPSHHPKKKEVK